MDYIRTCYVGKVRTWQDREENIEVRWFRAAEGAKLLPGPHHFGSRRTWEKNSYAGPGEVGETGYVKWDKGENPLGYEGKRHCGSDIACREGGLQDRDPVIQTDADGWASCCGVKPLVICGRQWPERFALDNGVVPHCPCVSGSTWVLSYQGVGGPFPATAGLHVWSVNWPWYEPATGTFPVPAEVPFWGTCGYGPPVDSPARVQFALLVDPETCEAALAILQFWRKATSFNNVYYGPDPVPVPSAGPLVLAFPATTTMHADSCGNGVGGGNPIFYTATPI